MNILVTAGNTSVPIDRVRCITNVFSGRTGTSLALEAHARGHEVTLLTSHPELAQDVDAKGRWRCFSYRTFEDLEQLMAQHIAAGPDAVIHCAAVNDYRVAGVYAPAVGSQFASADGSWRCERDRPTLVDRSAGKVKSDEPELWLRLVRTPKLVDRVRSDWKYRGLLVKFKLEVDVSPAKLLEIAESSRRHSGADWMVANTYDGELSSFYLGLLPTGYERVARANLPARLLALLERQHEARSHG